jgi:hypothetical protein
LASPFFIEPYKRKRCANDDFYSAQSSSNLAPEELIFTSGAYLFIAKRSQPGVVYLALGRFFFLTILVLLSSLLSPNWQWLTWQWKKL